MIGEVPIGAVGGQVEHFGARVVAALRLVNRARSLLDAPHGAVKVIERGRRATATSLLAEASADLEAIAGEMLSGSVTGCCKVPTRE